MPFGLDEINTLESYENATHEECAIALQKAINACMWSLQGSYGRSMMQAIDAGECMLGRNDTRDYWGNHIPSRDQVQAGTKGSYDYVVEHMGKEWADLISNIE